MRVGVSGNPPVQFAHRIRIKRAKNFGARPLTARAFPVRVFPEASARLSAKTSVRPSPPQSISPTERRTFARQSIRTSACPSQSQNTRRPRVRATERENVRKSQPQNILRTTPNLCASEQPNARPSPPQIIRPATPYRRSVPPLARPNIKKPPEREDFLSGAPGRNRTSTPKRTTDFESVASTSSATRALKTR